VANGSSGVALAPIAQRALRRRIVTWVMAASLSTAATIGGVWGWFGYQAARTGFERTASVSLELAALMLERSLDDALGDVARAARDGELSQALEDLGASSPAGALLRARAGSGSFESVVLVNAEGLPVAWSGEDPALADFVALLELRSATEAQLATVMRGVQLRKDLAAADAPVLRVLVLDGTARPVAGAPVRDATGRMLGSLQGLVGLESLAAILDASGPLSGTRLQIRDVDGDRVALSGSDDDPWEGRWALALDAWEAEGWTVVFEQAPTESLRPVLLPVAFSLAVALCTALLLGWIVFWKGSRQVRPLWELYLGIRRARSGEDVVLEPPAVHGEAESLVLAFNDTLEQLNGKRAALERELLALRGQNTAFQSQRRALAQLTVTDPLTQLANRRSFEEQLQKEIKRLSRHKEGLSMLVVDIDDFKKINDEFGHAAGDEFLMQVARILKEQARETDVVARYGGEEFVIIAPSTDLEGGIVLGERIRTAIAETSFIVEETMRPRKATVSVGVASYKGSQTGLFNAADAALYQAKAAGKNCVYVAEE